jgi:dienelactone hydrolase
MGLLPSRPLVKSNVDRSRSPIVIPFAILLVLALLGGLATLFALRHGGVETAGGTGDAVPVVGSPSPTSFVPVGPFGVGETTLSLPSNGAPVEVWYPAPADSAHGTPATIDLKGYLPASVRPLFAKLGAVIEQTDGIRGLPIAQGTFPLVVFSHGFLGFRTQSASLTSHLASWGFVVAAPEHLDRNLTAVLKEFLSTGTVNESGTSNDVADLEATISLMGSEDQRSTSPFYRHLDMGRIGALGHSAGGSAVEKLAVADSKVKVFVGLAGASYGSFGQTSSGDGASAPLQPGMLMYGERDRVVSPGTIKNAYNQMHQPKRLIGLTGAGHLVFTDICSLGSGQGGLVAIGLRAGLALPALITLEGTDGCSLSDVAPVAQRPVIDQSVVAELRWALGYDQTQGGLDGLMGAFPGLVSQNTSAQSVSGATPRS